MSNSAITHNKRWIYRPAPDQEQVNHIMEVLSVNQVLASLLVQRGATDFDTAKEFFRPDLNMLHDPFLMKDMDKAIDRLLSAIENREKILVFGDYDVDGTTSAALMYSFLKDIEVSCEYYIPDRYKEGYGISIAGIDYAAEGNFDLIIALDCGIKAVDKVAYANEKGIDFIICDHHLPGETLPDAVAVLDPKRSDCPYPYKELSGCGIGFKLVQGFSQRTGKYKEELYSLLDLVAVSIGADIVPLTGENRVLAHFGLIQINNQPRTGLAALIEKSGAKKSLNISNVVFMIGPRINAAGRIRSGMVAVELLVSKDKNAAMAIANDIENDNLNRRELDIDITQEALELIEAEINGNLKKSTVLFKENWHKGVIGIVASRVIEKHYRPTILLTASNGKATGSARSVHGFDVYEAIEACSDLLDQFGGHKYAAGLTLPVERVPDFIERFEKEVCSRITDELLCPGIDIDHDINLWDINTRFFRILNQFEPFGPGNMAPVFSSTGLHITSRTKPVGNGKHLSLEVFHPSQPELKFKAIAFGMGEMIDKVMNAGTIDIAYHIEENFFLNKTTLQLRVKDIRLPE